MYAEIIVDIASEQVDQVYTYAIPEGMELVPGMRVSVPFGPKTKEGYVIRLTEHTTLEQKRIKYVSAPLEDYPALLPQLMTLAEQIKEKFRCPLCEALRLMLPAEMRGSRIKVKTQTFVQLTIPKSEIQEAIEKQKNASRRKLLLTVLSDGQPHTMEELRSVVGNASEAVKYFADREWVRTFEQDVLRSPFYTHVKRDPDPELTDEQLEALEELYAALQRPGKPFLLHGVTGSGKTEVFIHLIRRALEMGKGAIILVPEIVLTPQMTHWFRGRFGDSAAVLHSRLTPGERFDEWRRIRFGDARIVIGARSAIFAPVENLGVVIVDEEHEQTYQSEHFPQYDARDMAAMRAQNEGAVLLLASATPSILSYAMARRGDYVLLEMPHRVHGRPLPLIHIVDMRKELAMGNHGMFSGLMLERLGDCIQKGQQAMLFINRRGYAPFVNCRKCGHVVECAQCDVPMTYHRADERMHCHYCGAQSPVPARCPACGSQHIRVCGVGTQRVEEEVKRLFPGVSTLRMDIDTTTGAHGHEKILDRFRAGQAQVLVGTQMIAKGLDFPQVTLVGAALADLTLNLPDYRAPERTFQLLVQVAGRAGRGKLPGEVVIQSYKPEHYAITAAATQDYRAFFQEEFERRKRDLYPPFTMMARFLCEADDLEVARAAADKLKDTVQAYLQDTPRIARRLLYIRSGEAPLAKLRGKYRAHVLMKLLVHPDTDVLLEYLQRLTQTPLGVKLVLEINPASLA